MGNRSTGSIKKKTIKVRKLKMWAVYSMWGYHAFYRSEEVARKHWKSSKKYEIYYDIFPCTITYSL